MKKKEKKELAKFVDKTTELLAQHEYQLDRLIKKVEKLEAELNSKQIMSIKDLPIWTRTRT